MSNIDFSYAAIYSATLPERKLSFDSVLLQSNGRKMHHTRFLKAERLHHGGPGDMPIYF